VRLKVNEATTPLPIAFVFIPASTQLYPAGAATQVTVSPAAAVPAAAVTELTFPAGYAIAHCSAPSEVMSGRAESVKFRVTLPPAVALPEESVKESWPWRSPQAIKRRVKEEDFRTG
jgi:hypothetical protein